MDIQLNVYVIDTIYVYSIIEFNNFMHIWFIYTKYPILYLIYLLLIYSFTKCVWNIFIAYERILYEYAAYAVHYYIIFRADENHIEHMRVKEEGRRPSVSLTLTRYVRFSNAFISPIIYNLTLYVFVIQQFDFVNVSDHFN